MTKMKKLFAVVLALTMLFTMASFSASADTTPTVTVTADETSVQVGDTIQVTVALANLGGVHGTFAYDKTKFTYKDIAFTGSINSKINNLKNNNGNLTLIIVDGTATLTFEATAAVDNTEFAFNVTAASNEEGTAKVTDVVCTPATVTVAKPITYGIEMLGATIRSTNEIDNQDLGFIGRLKTSEDAELVEFGMIAAFTKSLETATIADADFTLNTKDQLNVDGKTVVAHKAITNEDVIQSVVESDGLFTSHIIGTDSFELMGKNITARFYAKFNVGDEEKTVYSENTYKNYKKVETATTGVSKRSIVKVLGSLIGDICNSEDAPADVKSKGETAISDYNGAKTNDNKQKLLNFVSEYQNYLPTSELIG
ncbi:MAG: hypothetical protein IKK77_02330 [Clostridia bacterium]|nr:hypothetical protein [Clostridia bacterium]